MSQPKNPVRYFDSSPEVIRIVVMMYVRYPLSLRNVEDLLAARASTSATRRCGRGGTASVRCFAAEIRKKRVYGMQHRTQWRWHLR